MKKWEKFSEEELQKIYENSTSYGDFFKKIGYKGWNSCMSNELKNKYSWFKEKSLINLVGKKFGRLQVIQQSESYNQKRFWKCKCDCGNIVEKSTNTLMSGKTKSCGCIHRELLEQKQLIDLTNKQFGYWLVIDRDRTRVHKHKVFWNCKCLKCGTMRSVDGASLRSGTSISCGCQASRGEFFIKNFLEQYHIDYISQYHLKELKGVDNGSLSFDFFLPNFNICIEYQGIQHYKPIEFFGGEEKFLKQQQNDQIKKTFCEKNNLLLLEIPYKLSRDEIIKTLKKILNINEI